MIGSGTNSLTNSRRMLEVAGTLTLLDDLVTNTGGTITVDATDTLDLTGRDTINNGQFNNAGTIKVTGTGNEIENETGGSVIGSGTNSLTNTGMLEVAGTLTLLDDLVTNTGGTLTVNSTGTLNLTGGDTIDNGQFNNAGTVKVSHHRQRDRERDRRPYWQRHQQPDQYRDAGSGRHADAARRPGDQYRRHRHGRCHRYAAI